jgi:hypothetical protein
MPPMGASREPEAAADRLSTLTPEQREWLVHAESLWQRAHAIAREHPGHDPSDLYHACAGSS